MLRPPPSYWKTARCVTPSKVYMGSRSAIVPLRSNVAAGLGVPVPKLLLVVHVPLPQVHCAKAIGADGERTANTRIKLELGADMKWIEPVDGRKGIDSLPRLCQEKLAEDPFSGGVFVFRSRRETSIRLLIYDGQGYWLAQSACQKEGSYGSRNRRRWRNR